MVEINRARVRYLDTALRPYIAGCNGGFTWSRADVHYAGTPTILAHDKKIPSFEQPVIGHGKSAWPIKMVAKRHACLFKLGSEMGVVAIDSNSSAKPYSVLRRWVNHCGSYLDRSPSSTRIPDRACVPRKSELKMLAVERSPVTVNTASCSDVTVAPSCPGTGSSAITLPPLLTSITLVVLKGGLGDAAAQLQSTIHQQPRARAADLQCRGCRYIGSHAQVVDRHDRAVKDVQVAIALIRRRAGRTDHDRIGGDGGYACLDRVRGGNGWVISAMTSDHLALKSLKSNPPPFWIIRPPLFNDGLLPLPTTSVLTPALLLSMTGVVVSLVFSIVASPVDDPGLVDGAVPAVQFEPLNQSVS